VAFARALRLHAIALLRLEVVVALHRLFAPRLLLIGERAAALLRGLPARGLRLAAHVLRVLLEALADGVLLDVLPERLVLLLRVLVRGFFVRVLHRRALLLETAQRFLDSLARLRRHVLLRLERAPQLLGRHLLRAGRLLDGLPHLLLYLRAVDL